MRIIAFISLGDLVANFPFMFPYRPGEGNWWCSLSAFLVLSGYPMSWLWTLALTFELYRMCTSSEKRPSILLTHFVCWILPIFFALLTLAFSKYAPNNSIDVCSENYTTNVDIYHLVTYYGMLITCLIIMLGMLLHLKYLQYYQREPSKSNVFQLAIQSLELYPTSLFIFWIPHLVTVFGRVANTNSHVFHPNVYYICVIIRIGHGICTAIVFFLNSRVARSLWYRSFLFLLNIPIILRSETNSVAGTNSNRETLESHEGGFPAEDRVYEGSFILENRHTMDSSIL
jgi:hypothetical protein